MKKRHLISVDELRAAGALDVPAAWRKSLGNEQRSLPLFDGLDEEPLEDSSVADAEDDSDDLPSEDEEPGDD